MTLSIKMTQNITNKQRDCKMLILWLGFVFKIGSKVRVIVVSPVAAMPRNKGNHHPKYKIAQIVPNKIVAIHSIKNRFEQNIALKNSILFNNLIIKGIMIK